MPVAVWAVKMGDNGTILSRGDPQSDQSWDREWFGSTSEHLMSSEEEAAEEFASRTSPVKSPKKLVEDEEIEEGHVGWKPSTSFRMFVSVLPFLTGSAVTLLFGNMSSHPMVFWIGFLASLFLASGVLNAQVWLLGYWADQYQVKTVEPLDSSMWR